MFGKNDNIIPGNVYILDAQNKLKQFSDGIIYVVALEKVGKKRWKIRPTSSLGDKNENDTTIVPESMLSPIDGTVVRIPLDCPIINEKDLEILGKAIIILKNNPDEKEMIDMNRLDALYQKLEFAENFSSEED